MLPNTGAWTRRAFGKGNLNMSALLTPTTPLVITPSQDLVPVKEEIEPYPSREFEHPIPFSEFVSRFLPSTIRADYLTSGLAAEFTYKVDNPVFKLPTKLDERNGAVPAAFAMYAPYYIGSGLTPEQIANDVAEQAAVYLKQLDAEHGYDGYVGRVLSVLRSGRVTSRGLQGIEDRNILFDVHDFMALITNRLRHIGRLTVVGGKLWSVAEEYRADTHEIVDPYVNTVEYEMALQGLTERFELPEFIRSNPDKLVSLGWDFFKSDKLRRAAEFAALAAEKIGEPLVRGSLSELYVPADTRRNQYLLAAR